MEFIKTDGNTMAAQPAVEGYGGSVTDPINKFQVTSRHMLIGNTRLAHAKRE